jgi:hypothetical protein
MKHPTYNNRRIIWESKTTQLLAILVSLLFVIGALWTKDKTSSFMFWATIIFFGGGGLFMLIRLINPKNLFVTYNTKLAEQVLADQFQKAQEDLGFFAYNDTGFSLTERKGVTHYNWSDIETIFGFKEDHYTTDEICMDIFFSDKSTIRLTESTPGWYQFNKRLSQTISTVSEKWDTEIVIPAFATNMTLLFDKRGRTNEQAEKECYDD